MAVHASGGGLQELRQANTSLKTEIAGLTHDREAAKIGEAAAKASLVAVQAELAVYKRQTTSQAASLGELEDLVSSLQIRADRAQQTSLALLLNRDLLGSTLSFPSKSVYFDIQNSVSMSRDSSTSETAPDMTDDDDASEASSEGTVSFAAGDSTAASFSSSSAKKASFLRRALTIDDSGWFS